MRSALRTGLLALGLVFCLGFAAMTISVIAGLEIERWTYSTLLLIAFLVAAVLAIGMILIALISALLNPPDE